MAAGSVMYFRKLTCHAPRWKNVSEDISIGRLSRKYGVYSWNGIKQLLVETDFTLETIAELAGFEHPEYMSVLFKRETGQTPGKYRSQSSGATSGNSLEISGNYLPH